MLARDEAETQSERRQRKRAEEDARADEAFRRAHNAQRSYGAALRGYAKQIAHIIRYHAEGDPLVVPPEKLPHLMEALRRYRLGSGPWARATAWRMLLEVNQRNLTAWRKHAAAMSAALRLELSTAPVGEALQALLAAQVDLITSLPWDAARDVQEASTDALLTSARYPEREAEIEAALARAHPDWIERKLRTRATLIARTETARSASVLVQARAEHIGANEYEWLTSGDWKVRPSHRRLNHSRQRWDDPPLSDAPDYHSHPGQIFNCRCVALPILPE
jgi:SPP1 gp7 family putative phage head morphogenesis protein